MASNTKPTPSPAQAPAKAAQAPVAGGTPVPPVAGAAPVAGTQNLPTAPVAPAVKAAKAKKELTPAQIELKKKIAEMQAEFNTSIGKVTKAKAAPTASSYGGFTGSETISVTNSDGVGFKNAEHKALAKLVEGKPISEAVKLDDIDWPWLRYRLVRGTIKLDGMTIQDAYKVAKAAPADIREKALAAPTPAPAPAPAASPAGEGAQAPASA